jgi:hypothetical protein
MSDWDAFLWSVFVRVDAIDLNGIRRQSKSGKSGARVRLSAIGNLAQAFVIHRRVPYLHDLYL